MRTFSQYHPTVTAAYFLLTAGIAAFFMHPVLLLLSLAGALCTARFCVKKGKARKYLFCLALFLILTLINPLFAHIGKTVFFYVNDRPITMEALIYGATASGTVVSVILLFFSFSAVMTKDRILRLFSSFAPKFALVLSTAFRFIPLFASRGRRVKEAQTATGLMKDGNVVDRIKGGARIFSVMTTWGLEKAIVTSDSMSSRGYGTGKRTNYVREPFRISDAFALFPMLSLSGVCTVCAALGAFGIEYYPAFVFPPLSTTALIGYVSYGLLCLIPAAIDIKETIKWKYLRSKI